MNMTNIAFVQAERNMTLTEVFSVGSCVPNLTCGAAEKLAVTKFLLALTTAAIRPKTRREIEALDNAEVARKVSSYLSENRSLFEMDGDNAFLQYSESEKAKPNPIEAFIPGLVAGNRGVIRSTEVLTKVTPADIARALLFAVILPFTGKKTDAHVWIDSSGQGKKKGFFTPALGMGGLVHTFVLGHTLLDTLRLNLVAEEELIGTPFTAGLGIAPWEKKPTENNAAADDLRHSLMGRLVPMLRFARIDADSIRLTYGVEPEADIDDPTVTTWIDEGKKKVARMLAASHWQALASAFGFGSRGEELPLCRQLQWCLPYAQTDSGFAGILMVGLRTTWNSGEQYFSTGDETFCLHLQVTGKEFDLKSKFSFLQKLTSAIYRCHSELQQCIEATKLDDKPELKGNSSRAQIRGRVDLTVRAFVEDIPDLLRLTDPAEIEAYEREMAVRARDAIRQAVRTAGAKCLAYSGRIELNVESFFKEEGEQQ